MNNSTQKIVQYLDEAHASEAGLVRVLQSQIAMTPRGSYRTELERHLRETRDHARRVEARLGELGHGGNPIMAGIGLAETVIGQALALGKTPLDLLRGSGGEEKVLKNAKDAAATEALEIATYTSIEQLARAVGDETSAQLAASIRADEERMLQRILEEIPKLTDAVVGADVHGAGSYDAGSTGAGDAAKAAGRRAAAMAKGAASRIPGTTADRGGARQPWPGYDVQTVAEIQSRLTKATDARARAVRDYERAHQNRASVIEAAERELATA